MHTVVLACAQVVCSSLIFFFGRFIFFEAIVAGVIHRKAANSLFFCGSYVYPALSIGLLASSIACIILFSTSQRSQLVTAKQSVGFTFFRLWCWQNVIISLASVSAFAALAVQTGDFWGWLQMTR